MFSPFCRHRIWNSERLLPAQVHKLSRWQHGVGGGVHSWNSDSSDSRVPAWKIGENGFLKLNGLDLVLSLNQIFRSLGSKRGSEDTEMITFPGPGLQITNSVRPSLCFLLPDHIMLLAPFPPLLKRSWDQTSQKNPPGRDGGHTICIINKK